MKKSLLIISFLLVALISFVIGTRVGTEAYILSDAKFKASIITYKLEALDNNRLSSLRTFLETDLETELYYHAKSENNFIVTLWPDLNYGAKSELGRKSLKHAATYVKNHPAMLTSNTVGVVSPEDKQFFTEYNALINQVVKKYAQ